MTSSPDPFEFVKQLWGQMAVPGFGLNAGAGAPGNQMPSFDPKELEKRLAELRQVKQWLEMNLNMMGLQINTLEMQLAAMNGLNDATGKAFSQPDASAAKGPGAGPASGAPWMDPQAWMTFMQNQAAATQQAAQKAMQDGAKVMQSVNPAAAPAAKRASRKNKS